MKLRLFHFCLFFLISATLFAQNADLQNRIKAVEQNLIPYVPVKGFKGWNIKDRMAYYKVPGLSVAVIKNFKIDWAKGYGFANLEQKKPVTTETMFSAGSISKFVTAMAALELVEQGKLHLDSPINYYLASWKIKENDFTKKKPVTLRMLLSHTGGTSQSSYFGFTPDKNPLPSIVEILDGAAISESRPVVVNSQPGKEFRYSGGGSMIAQLAMMDLSGQFFDELLGELVFNRLTMNNTTFQQPVPAKFAQQTAWAYSSAPWFKGMPYVYPQQAAAGLYTTPTDLAKIFIDVQKSYQGKGEILQQSTARQMLSPQALVSEGGYKEEIGIGPFLIQRMDNTETKGKYFEFTGVNAGFLAYGMADFEQGNGVIVMLNSGDDVNGLGKEIRRAVAKAYNWYQFLPQEISPIKMSNKALDKYVGRYRRNIDEVVYIRREKNYLVENINEGGDIYCFPVAKDTIIFTDYNIKGSFETDKNGYAISLKSVWQEKPMPKMKANEFTPGEFLRAKKYEEAKAGYREMKMNEYQISYLAYDLLNKKPGDLNAVKVILELALEQHPNSAIVYSRWGDYYLNLEDKPAAIKSFQKAVAIDPNDEQAKEILKSLLK